MTALTVFGTKPQDAIFLPNQPFAVRNNCQVGQWAVGDDDYRGSQLEMSIIKVSQFFGNLGKAKNTQWIQIFFVPVPSCDSKSERNRLCQLH